MKPKSDCIACLVERTKYECDIAFNDDSEKIRAMEEFIAFLMAHLGEEGKAPAFFGTERERIIKRRSGVKDPHREIKRRSNEVAKGLLPEVSDFYDAAVAKSGNKLEALVRIAAAANSMEYGVKGYFYDDDAFKDDFVHTLSENLNWDKDVITSAIKERNKILYLTDNAGEVFFDAFVIRELIELGKEVVVSPKSAPVINDATTEDVKEAIEKVGISDSGLVKIVPSGSCIGMSLEEAEEEFMDVFCDDRYLVIAKGMGNYETISEFEARAELRLSGRLIYAFRAKCEPIASNIGVKRGELVAKLVSN
ncbi:MAG: ARMT1-like domain-containing protein [Halobacteriota archaeon]